MRKKDSGEQSDDKEDETSKEVVRLGVGFSTSEIVGRFGSANAEHVKGYTGVDFETGKVSSKSLRGMATGRVHADCADANIKQQAGFSAEVAASSLDNAQAIIDGRAERTYLSLIHI